MNLRQQLPFPSEPKIIAKKLSSGLGPPPPSGNPAFCLGKKPGPEHQKQFGQGASQSSQKIAFSGDYFELTQKGKRHRFSGARKWVKKFGSRGVREQGVASLEEVVRLASPL